MNGLVHRISINHFLKSKVTTRDDGEVLRDHIEKFWEDVDSFRLDFSNIQIASVSFLDEALGMLAMKHSKREIEDKLKIVHMDEFDAQMYASILSSRLKQFARHRRKRGSADRIEIKVKTRRTLPIKKSQ